MRALLAEDWTDGCAGEWVTVLAASALSPEQLFHAIKSFVMRYVVFSRPEHADVITLWIMHTWVADFAISRPTFICTARSCGAAKPKSTGLSNRC